jgi:hypothetical protein
MPDKIIDLLNSGNLVKAREQIYEKTAGMALDKVEALKKIVAQKMFESTYAETNIAYEKGWKAGSTGVDEKDKPTEPTLLQHFNRGFRHAVTKKENLKH